MTKLSWNNPGERRFESGLDRGVLYLPGVSGIPWNGLVSVDHTTSGGEVVPRYIDGGKYLNRSKREEFVATIRAFTYPDEFMVCDGTATLGSGLQINQQRKTPFNLSYRTKIGNDTQGLALGYKLHLIYSAMATPTNKTYASIANAQSILTFGWGITTTPQPILGLAPSAHLIIDSTTTDPELMAEMERILYGTDTLEPRFPSAQEVKDFFGAWPFQLILNSDLSVTAIASDSVISVVEDGVEIQITWDDITTPVDGVFTITTPEGG